MSRICAALDAEVERFRSRPLGETNLWLDATYLKVREAGRVVSMAALVAVEVATTGERRILGLELLPGNDEARPGPRSSGTWSGAARTGSAWSSATVTRAS